MEIIVTLNSFNEKLQLPPYTRMFFHCSWICTSHSRLGRNMVSLTVTHSALRLH